MKTTSLVAMVAAAGILLGAAVKPVKAADLGGGCCADLEERVAELEATTARKGNRVVSLQVYGQVNKALMIWDDGIDSDAYVVDNDASSSRFGLTGSAKIKPGWSAGFKIEAEVDSAASNTVGQDDPIALDLGSNGDDGQRETGLNVRRVETYIESERLGRVSIGLISGAIDDITLIDLASTSANSQDNFFSGGFFVRTAQGLTDEEDYFATNTDPALGGVTWGDIAPSLDRGREDAIRYDSPSIYGFIVSAAWGEDDYWDVALRFKKEWNSIRIAAGIGYMDDMDTGGDDIESVRGSISIMHIPTGIYGNFAAIDNEEDDGGSLDGEYYYFALGIAKNWTGYGNTIIYGEYGNYSDFGLGTAVNIDQTGTADEDILIGSEVDYWGFGIEQKFDSAALSIYLNFKFYEADLAFDDGVDALVNNTVTEDFQAVVIGTKIQF